MAVKGKRTSKVISVTGEKLQQLATLLGLRNARSARVSYKSGAAKKGAKKKSAKKRTAKRK